MPKPMTTMESKSFPKPIPKMIQNGAKTKKIQRHVGYLGRDLGTARWGFPFFIFFMLRDDFGGSAGYPIEIRVGPKTLRKI